MIFLEMVGAYSLEQQMKILLYKSGKVKYMSKDGLVFSKKEHCIFYEQKHMWKKECSQKKK